jgi:ELWxxDGT repeat protein
VYFTADNGVNGVELWKSGGNALSTVMVKDIDPGRGASNPFDLTNADGTLYFFANNGDTDGGGDPLWQLWKSDGTAAGTVMVKEFDLRRPTDLKAVNGGVDSSPITRV